MWLALFAYTMGVLTIVVLDKLITHHTGDKD